MGFDPGLAVAPVLPGAGKPMEKGVGTAAQARLLFTYENVTPLLRVISCSVKNLGEKELEVAFPNLP